MVATERGVDDSIAARVDDDAELFDRWAAGDRDAGDQLLRRHFRTVYGFFHGKVAGGVEDLVQATFLACVRARDRFRREASFRAFLLGLARLELFAHYRHVHRDARIDGAVTSLRDLGPSATGLLAAHEEQRALLEAMRRIPLDLQIVLELSYWHRMNSTELGAVLDIPAPTVRSRLRRAKEALLEQLPQVTADVRVCNAIATDLEVWSRALPDSD